MPDEGYAWKLDRNADGRPRWIEVWGPEASMWRALQDREIAAAERVLLWATRKPLPRGWEMPAPRYGAPWTEQEYADLRAVWGTMPTEDIAKIHGRSVNSINLQAHDLGLKGAPEKAKREKVTAVPPDSIPGVPTKPVAERPAKPVKVKPALPPEIELLCASGLGELTARVLLLATQHHGPAEIAQLLSLPRGARSVAAHFQMAGIAWGINGKGAHKAITLRADNLLRGRSSPVVSEA